MMICSCFPKKGKRGEQRRRPRNDAIKRQHATKRLFLPPSPPRSLFLIHFWGNLRRPSMLLPPSLPPSLPPGRCRWLFPPSSAQNFIRHSRAAEIFRSSFLPPWYTTYHGWRCVCVFVQRLLMMWEEGRRRRRYTTHTLALRGECVDGPLSSLYANICEVWRRRRRP